MNLEHIKPQGRGKCQKINIDVDEDFTKKFVKGYLNNTLTSIFFLLMNQKNIKLYLEK